ncbi:hypothetical protein D781_2196 [Serratia sp. FGI94]|uniref:contact-dependent growth inhibition system immunity protein n=1 Tax=Serratia sp. FGI94 TaxID=671990 RepID=UPI0002A6FD0F|nr:contact-dependent growth inhibition system immunity protein [Serratia sp. FGI94]AGB82467.1 hypothetical protein D781_2196 [Serratia sp. FGI94]
MRKLNLNELGCFITIYFGQDYDLIDDSNEIEPKISAFLNSSDTANWHGLLADIDLLVEESDDLDSEFMLQFGFEFDPALWGTSPANFLQLVKSKILQALSEYTDDGMRPQSARGGQTDTQYANSQKNKLGREA